MIKAIKSYNTANRTTEQDRLICERGTSLNEEELENLLNRLKISICQAARESLLLNFRIRTKNEKLVSRKRRHLFIKDAEIKN